MTEDNSRPSHIVLVVEDDEVLRELLLDYLQDCGFVVYQAANADEACGVVKESGAIELVVTDINMPGSMDGEGLADWLLETHPSMPVILMSGRISKSSLKGPHHRFLGKPYALSELEGEVRELLD